MNFENNFTYNDENTVIQQIKFLSDKLSARGKIDLGTVIYDDKFHKEYGESQELYIHGIKIANRFFYPVNRDGFRLNFYHNYAYRDIELQASYSRFLSEMSLGRGSTHGSDFNSNPAEFKSMSAKPTKKEEILKLSPQTAVGQIDKCQNKDDLNHPIYGKYTTHYLVCGLFIQNEVVPIVKFLINNEDFGDLSSKKLKEKTAEMKLSCKSNPRDTANITIGDIIDRKSFILLGILPGWEKKININGFNEKQEKKLLKMISDIVKENNTQKIF